MMKKLLKITIIVFAMITSIFLTACDNSSDQECVHTFSDEWSYDDDFHWHVATCEHTELTSEKIAHVWDESVETKKPTASEEGEKKYTCTVCGKEKKESVPKLISYSVEFWGYENEEEVLLSCQKVLSNGDATAPAISERTDYGFYGWDRKLTNVTKDMKVNALYLKNTTQVNDFSLVSVNNNDGTITMTVYVRGVVNVALLEGNISWDMNGLNYVSSTQKLQSGLCEIHYSKDEKSVNFAIINATDLTEETALFSITLSYESQGDCDFVINIDDITNAVYEKQTYSILPRYSFKIVD